MGKRALQASYIKGAMWREGRCKLYEGGEVRTGALQAISRGQIGERGAASNMKGAILGNGRCQLHI